MVEFKYTNFVTKKFNDNRCIYAFVVVFDVVMNLFISVMNFVIKGVE